MPSQHDTLSVASVNRILFAARQQGIETDVLAESVGISTEQLRDPDSRVLIRQVQALWQKIVTATGDPTIALKLGEIINPVAIGVLAYVMMHSPTLGQAIDKLCQYQDIVCEGIATTGQRSASGSQFILSLRITSPDIIYPEYTLNSELSVYLSAMRALTGFPITFDEVQFSYPHPTDTQEHERIFAPAHLTFDADVTALIFDATLLDLPILNASPTLSYLFEKHATDILSRLKAPSLPK